MNNKTVHERSTQVRQSRKNPGQRAGWILGLGSLVLAAILVLLMGMRAPLFAPETARAVGSTIELSTPAPLPTGTASAFASAAATPITVPMELSAPAGPNAGATPLAGRSAATPEASATPPPFVESQPLLPIRIDPAVQRSLRKVQIQAVLRAHLFARVLARQQLTTTHETLMLPLVQSGGTPIPPLPESLPAATSSPTPAAAPEPLPAPDSEPGQMGVPVLMYHYLSTPPPGADIYRQDLSVSPTLFASHLDALQQAGYTTITLDELFLHLTQGESLPPNPVVLTFDDGYRDNYFNAFPLLQERGMTATFFIVTDFIDLQRPEYVTWDMVREMYAAGMSIESHGRNHVSLANQDDDYLVWQALGSLETIEYEIGERPRFISYPAGEFDQNTIRIFQSANYWAGFTTQQGTVHRGDDLFRLKRVRVRGTTSAEELLRLVAMAW